MAKDFEMAICSIFTAKCSRPNSARCCASITTMTSPSARSEKTSASPGRGRGTHQAWRNGLRELEEKVGFAARYRRVQQTLEELEQLVIDARFECTGPNARLTTTEYAATLNKMLGSSAPSTK